MSVAPVLYEKLGDVIFLRLNDPASLNAISPAVTASLLDGFATAQEEARAIVIGSVGRAFCSGANLSDGSLDSSPERDIGAAVERFVNPLILAIRKSRVPVITAVRGAAAGAGCGLACAGDLVVAGEGAYFYLAFSRVGLSADAGSSYLLTRAIGRMRAMELMLLGDKLPAAKALDWGLVTRVVSDEDVDAVALELARKMAAGPRSLGMIRDAAWAALEHTLEAQLEFERKLQRDAGRTADFLEGVAAFAERRPARFEGR
jgi:2-(1,2-epoxy-1,2-dihydrophenyl)acetyl-CoA isomerase